MRSLNYFKSLSDITRIRVYNILLNFELSVNELVQLLGMGQSGISRHLKILTDAALLKCRRSGVWAFYSADLSNGKNNFADSVQSLFEEEPILKHDLLLAERIIAARQLETSQFFNTIAHKWDLLKLEIMGKFDLNAVIADKIKGADVVADLGCGTGELLSNLAASGAQVIGVDSSSSMLNETRKRFFNKETTLDLRLGELEHLPLKDNEAEVAVISLALHHLSAPEAAIAEAERILKPGGTLIIAEFEKHNNDLLQKAYGDRWLGFSKVQVKGWLVGNNFITSPEEEYNIQQSLKIVIYKSIKKFK